VILNIWLSSLLWLSIFLLFLITKSAMEYKATPKWLENIMKIYLVIIIVSLVLFIAYFWPGISII
jgi:hypothetical protein